MGWIHRIGWRTTTVALLIAVLAARLAWIAGHTETGWETVADDCHAAVVGQFFGYQLPLHMRTSSEQADYWNREITRIFAMKPIDARVLEGAIWAINSPFYGYRRFPSPAFAAIPEIDAGQPGFNALPPDLDSELLQTHELVLQLIHQAVSELPNSRGIWRTICFQILPFEKGASDLLNECRSRDPENALYDYYSAYLAIQEVDRVERSKEHALRQRAIEDIETGLQKRSLEFPVENDSVIEFLSNTTLPRSEQLRVSLSIQDRFSGPWFLTFLWGEILWRQHGETDSDRQQADALLLPYSRQMLKLGLTPHMPCGALVQYSYAAAARLIPTQLPTEFMRRKSAIVAKLDMAQRKWNSQHQAPRPWNTWLGYIARASAELSIFLLLCVALTATVSQLFKRRIADASQIQTPQLGMVRQCVAWTMALLLTIILFGLAPAGVIPATVQALVLAVLLLALLTLLPLGVASWWGGRFSLSVLLKLVFFYAVVFGFLNYWNISTGALSGFPHSIRVNPHDIGAVPSTRIQAALGLPDYSPRWIALQWVLFQGATWTIALALLAIGWWTLDRAKRAWKQAGDGEAKPEIRRYWLAWIVSRSVASAAAGAAAVALAVFLALEPERIAHFEAIYLDDYRRVHDPDVYWSPLKQEQAKLIEEMRADLEAALGNASPNGGGSP